ncbi:2,4-dienoyl-CoA reductase, mitochondrial [Eurytemora carolleeae]|uniref:2,4-dienoyl-CoA reductase, mitochondrial n=1 Tax=Eurytemora carolleeae TaxID=1294199 RepID=UPI000C7780EE|nr:2,4-dienoyl-CoA reductase, mitochondrial [Eurytemora carolleeae]|eukprot:XP_023335095.1 2,4-dienoyl-CoA reductase, mitochondrial-like [Eurytemora affinis]
MAALRSVVSHARSAEHMGLRGFTSSCAVLASDAYSPKPQAKFFPARKDTMLPPETYKDKVVLVTGGGTGLGKGMTLKFSQLGAKVAIASRRLPVLESAAKEISAQTGNIVLPVQLDIRDPLAVKAAVDKIESELGLPNVVIHNAAGNFISPTERLSANAFQTIIDIVLKGTAFLTLDVGKRMIAQKTGGVFLAITTHYTNEGSGFVVPSACAKSGVETMCKSLGVEWGRYGIRFNCIAPGPIETEGAFGRLDPTGEGAKLMLDGIPVGRIGEIEEIANLATFMCSDFASWINAETVTLDGGEFRSLAGEFNKLRMVSEEQWDFMEQVIRSTNKKSKM